MKRIAALWLRLFASNEPSVPYLADHAGNSISWNNGVDAIEYYGRSSIMFQQ